MTEQPVRHTVDTITSDALDQLYARIAWLEQALATVADCFHENADDLEAALRLFQRARKARVSTVIQARRWAARARTVEATVEHVRALTDAFADPKHRGKVGIPHGLIAYTFRAVLDEPKEPTP